MPSFVEQIKNNKKVNKMIIGGVVITLVGGSLLWYNTRKNAYALSVNGEVVAVVKEKEQATAAYEELVTSLKKDIGVDIAVNETLELEPIHSKASEMNTYDELVKALSENISYGVEAYEILVDGNSYAVIDSQSAAETILTEIAKAYLPAKGQLTLEVATVETETSGETEVSQGERAEEENRAEAQVTQSLNTESTEVTTTTNNQEIEKVEVADALPQEEVTNKVSVGNIQVEENAEETEETEKQEGQKIQRTMHGLDFNEEVTVRNVYVDQSEILSAEKAKEVLLDKRYETITYELKEGDNIWDIAVKHGTTMERILELNSQIVDETRMQIGDVIQLEVPKPILSISTVEEATFKELIPGEIEYVEFSDLYKDETKIYQEGNDGLKELTVEVTKVNGVEVSRQTVSEKVLKEPKTKVIAYGTKERPVVTKPTTNSGSSSSNSGSSSSNSSSSSNNSSNSGSSSKPSTSSGKFIHPLKGAGRVSSGYGSRWGSFHKGIDYAASAGTPIYASAAGQVIYSGYNNGGYGKLIIIDHGNGYQTYYAHCSSLYVNVGAYVSQGQNIAGVGSTGDSTGNHLHFEVRKNGTPINPTSVY